MGDRGHVEQEVRGAAEGRVHGYRVREARWREDVASRDAAGGERRDRAGPPHREIPPHRLAAWREVCHAMQHGGSSTACERSRRSGNTHARSSAFRCSPQQKDRLGVLPDESLNVVHSSPQKIRNLRRLPSHQGPGKEIIVFRDDDEASRLGESPDSFIILVGEPDIAHVATAGKARQKNFHEPKRQVLVEKSLHATDPRRRRSRSAAKAKQARISSMVSSGKSERISASVIPEARYSSTSETVIRKPRMQGFPLRFPGSTVIRLEKFAVMT